MPAKKKTTKKRATKAPKIDDRNRTEYMRKRRLAASSIGPIPDCANPDRRESCEKNLRLFLETYMPHAFPCPFSSGHIELIDVIQTVILDGGLFVEAVYRGFGKSTIAEGAVLWAGLYGHRQMCPLIGANKSATEKSINSIKSEMENNDDLLADFPEVCKPVRSLQGRSQRAKSQSYTIPGKDEEEDSYALTKVEWKADEIVLPSVKGSPSAGVVITVYPILSRKARGLRFKKADGTQVRPDFVLIDDPQDDEQAKNPRQVTKILDRIHKGIIMSGSHTKRISALITCTVIEENDVADQLLDQDRNPQWLSKRIPMVETFGDEHEGLWQKYKEIRHAFNAGDVKGKLAAEKQATEFYGERREEMDKGVIVAWEHCFDHSCEISAIQHAYNILFDFGENTFASECQNKPLTPGDVGNLTYADLEDSVRNIKKSLVPSWTNVLTAGVDVHDDILFYVVASWDRETFGGHLVDFGVFPEQKTTYFNQGAIHHNLNRKFPGTGKEAAIRAGLDHVLGHLMSARYKAQDGTEREVDRACVDSGYVPDIVFNAIIEEADTRVCYPSRGTYAGAKREEFNDTTRKRQRASKSEVTDSGDNWRMCKIEKYAAIRRIFYDSNKWKSFMRDRILQHKGDEGSFSFPETSILQKLLFDHMLSEKFVVVEAKGRTVEEWEPTAVHVDNHWLDCLVQSAVAASSMGCGIKGVTRKARVGKLKLKVSSSSASALGIKGV